MHFTITDKLGKPKLSAYPGDDNRSVAYLYHSKEQAQENIDHSEDPSAWQIAEVEQEQWLSLMLNLGHTDVYGLGSSKQDIRYLLTSIRAIAHGKKLLGG